MQHFPAIWPSPLSHLSKTQPDHPLVYLSPVTLQSTARHFCTGFGGLVTYAVKANDRAEVLDNLVAAGITTFDVASPAEMAAVRAASVSAVLHYNNPVRSQAEIGCGIAQGVASWSVDHAREVEKLVYVPRSCEIAVRFALPVSGAAYDFGDKFGATPDQAVDVLRQVAQQGWAPALCFHPGTQCEDAAVWVTYIQEAAKIAERAGVRISRLNVGGGFAADRTGCPPNLNAVFAAITTATRKAFGKNSPALICEPGRAMVSDAFVLASRIKALRNEEETVFLNDGIYGGLADLRDMGLTGRVQVVSPDGVRRAGKPKPRIVFGPTCDSLDRLPDGLMLAKDAAEGDYVLFSGMGAYSLAMSTRFNGYGLHDVVSVQQMAGH